MTLWELGLHLSHICKMPFYPVRWPLQVSRWAVDTFRSHYSADLTQNSPKDPGSRGRINKPSKKFTWKCKLQNTERIEETNHPLPHEQINIFDFFPVFPLVIGPMQTCFYVITVPDEYNFLCCFFSLNIYFKVFVIVTENLF